MLKTLHSTPLVSIIIPTFNRADYLKKAIESAQQQTYPHTEIIVVNDGSTDGTADYLNQCQGITFINQENMGNAAARNRGLKIAKGKYIGFLDSDDQWLPEKCEEQVQYLEDHFTHAFVYSGTHFINDQDQIVGQRVLQHNEQTTYQCLFEKNRIISFSVSLIRKSALDDVGWLDEKLLQSTDYDLWLRLAKKYQFGYISKILTLYRLHDQNISGNLEGRIKAHLRTFKKHDLMQGRSWLAKRKRIASIYFQAADQYYEKHLFRKGAYWYGRAAALFPTIGMHQWPRLYRDQSSAWIKRVFKVYYRIGRGIFKGNQGDLKSFQKGKQGFVTKTAEKTHV